MALTPIDSICFLCVCLHCTTEKIELPNSTSTEVEMTPPSDASEPVQNGNLSHTIEAAEAQVWLFPLVLDVLTQLPFSSETHAPGQGRHGGGWVLFVSVAQYQQRPPRVSSSLCTE